MAVIRSILFGSTPSWMTRSCVLRSSTVMPGLPNPNCCKAPIKRSALPLVGRMKKSISAEYRGKPCQETASAPTTKNSTLFECKHSTNSRESLFSGIYDSPLLQLKENLYAFFRRHGLPFPTGSFIRFFQAPEDTNDLFHGPMLCHPPGEAPLRNGTVQVN